MRYLFPLIVVFGCSWYNRQPLGEVETPHWDNSFDSSRLDQAHLVARRLTEHFYRTNHYQLVWKDTAGTLPVGDSMVAIILSAARYGLEPSDYHIDRIDALLLKTKDDPARLDLDFYLTDSFFALYCHLGKGRITKKLDWIDLSGIENAAALTALRQGINDNNIRAQLESQEPRHSQYHELKAELARRLNEQSPDDKEPAAITTLKVNMERWRWIEKPLPDRYIAVNAPAFKMFVIENDSVVLESRVIVGKKNTPTPELTSVIRSFTIYPYWHVPRSIVKEILPHIQADSTYMARHNYQILDSDGKVMDPTTLDWSSFTPEKFPYTLRQREGSENSMGVLKFIFANNYNVFLHDTNARGLFGREDRALSHGCVRVQKAVALAHYLAKDDDTYVGPEDLDQYLLLQHRMDVKVVRPIPVLLQYFTAAVENGKVAIYEDIYEKDQDILNALYHVSLHHHDEQSDLFM